MQTARRPPIAGHRLRAHHRGTGGRRRPEEPTEGAGGSGQPGVPGAAKGGAGGCGRREGRLPAGHRLRTRRPSATGEAAAPPLQQHPQEADSTCAGSPSSTTSTSPPRQDTTASYSKPHDEHLTGALGRLTWSIRGQVATHESAGSGSVTGHDPCVRVLDGWTHNPTISRPWTRTRVDDLCAAATLGSPSRCRTESAGSM